jgi:hypothetical protein
VRTRDVSDERAVSTREATDAASDRADRRSETTTRLRRQANATDRYGCEYSFVLQAVGVFLLVFIPYTIWFVRASRANH